MNKMLTKLSIVTFVAGNGLSRTGTGGLQVAFRKSE